MSDLAPSDLDSQAQALLDELKPRRRRSPRLAEPLREAEDVRVATPHGEVVAWRAGAGPAVLLVHGWEDDNCLWGPAIDAFQQMGRACVAFDLPGHGFSPAPNCDFDIAAAAILAVAAELGPVEAVVTHSFGGPATVNALNQGLDVARCVLIASPIPREGRWHERLRQADAPAEVIERALEIRAGQMSTIYDVEAGVRALAARGDAPAAMFVHSLDDEGTPAGNSERLSAAWPGARLALVDDLGHRLVAQDAAVLQRVVDFVERIG